MRLPRGQGLVLLPSRFQAHYISRSSFLVAVTSVKEAVVYLSALSIPRTPLPAPLSRDGGTLPTKKGDQFDNVPARISDNTSSGLQDNMSAHPEVAKTMSSPQYATTSGLGPWLCASIAYHVYPPSHRQQPEGIQSCCFGFAKHLPSIMEPTPSLPSICLFDCSQCGRGALRDCCVTSGTRPTNPRAATFLTQNHGGDGPEQR